MSRATESLVKYENPILVTTSKREANRLKPNATATEDVLNSILPPREWTEEGQLWVQYVSSDPATRHDVVNLQEELDKRLIQRKARETGICPIREELYSQCFDELIRQVTINCTERGLLLLRIRDEIRMTITSYRALYESSIAYGIRKALQSEQQKTKLEEEAHQLERECVDLEKEVGSIKQQIQSLEENETKKREEASRKHQQEMEALKKHNESLKEELQKVLSLPKQAKK
ncbi:flagellar inner arm dynein light chain p28 [Reticulomyxa filosa]|uniref:Flagellar inner arm dynein light chain p28 n=1 Tax=Reticulomyxa filosa TaxID=46433 RepID=X6N4S4_RETFI|nr:flagellar inner arm dynein light chain p28 [Reticulomyxa filosa]|eukprot:ETO21026.1 flagellar inner arm dynein light chain p28 [Reticulomyxa filosa]